MQKMDSIQSHTDELLKVYDELMSGTNLRPGAILDEGVFYQVTDIIEDTVKQLGMWRESAFTQEEVEEKSMKKIANVRETLKPLLSQLDQERGIGNAARKLMNS